jgi:ABC-type polar amino acid transport system ATPase subunit
MNMPVPIKAVNIEPWDRDESRRLPSLTTEIPNQGITCLVGNHSSILAEYLRALGGVDDLRDGQLYLFGEPFKGITQEQWQHLRLKIGFVARTAPLLSVLNGLENVILPPLYHKRMSREEAEAVAKVLLTDLDCQADLSLLPAYLTPLERTQLAIARSAILEPPVMLLEEPYHELDCNECGSITRFLSEWSGKHSLVISTRNLNFVKSQAARIIFADREKILYFDSWQEFVQSDENLVGEYLQQYRDSYYL